VAAGDHQRQEGRLPRALPIPLGGHELTARLLRGWLSTAEVARLRHRAITLSPWIAGRQGTGYDKALLRDATDPDDVALLLRALDVVAPDRERVGGDWQLWDAWLLRYPAGAHIAPHTDPAMEGHRHVRLNALLTAPEAGGQLLIDELPYALEVGDAIVFRPDVQRHAVSEVSSERLLFSVGAWCPVG
jgi:hypothetical protein